MGGWAGLAVSAPSKVILHGEHSVVYGKTAVAGALDLRTRMTIRPHSSHVVVKFPDLGISDSWSLEQLAGIFEHRPRRRELEEVDLVYLDRLHDWLGREEEELGRASLICFLYLYSVTVPARCPTLLPLQVEVESEIPLGAGLGSSAALSVCLAAGLAGVLHQVCPGPGKEFTRLPALEDADRRKVCRLAFLSEKILHGNPSGIDNSVSTWGGLCSFSAGSLTTLPLATPLSILLVNTRVERQTKQLVAEVRARYESQPGIVKPLLDSMEGVVQQFLSLLGRLQAGDSVVHSELGRLVDCNQGLLTALGVSHPALHQVCLTLAHHGLHAKLTGAGGGGFAFALVPPGTPDTTVLQASQELEAAGYSACLATVGGGGVAVSLLE